ncbi:hypothetical protein JTB14_035441 [Gonioctena quinquepunctata]|nr:hypothetical protein JTB14_035441 [Gonioctena quinquepunctata]
MDRDIYRGLVNILKNKSDFSRKADQVNEIFKIFKVVKEDAICYLNRLAKYNPDTGTSLQREFVRIWGAKCFIAITESLSSSDGTDDDKENENIEEEKMEISIPNVEVNNEFQALLN